MKIKRPHIVLKNIQIKSLKKFKKLARALDVIEEECGIKETRITVKNIFFCSDIDKKKCKSTPMEKLLLGICLKASPNLIKSKKKKEPVYVFTPKES